MPLAVDVLLFTGLYVVFRALLRIDARKVLFASDSVAELRGNQRCLFDEVSRSRPDAVLAVNLREGVHSHRPFRQTARLARDLATSRVVVLDDYFPELYRVRVRSGTFVLQVWHASGAFKKVGFSRMGLPGGPRRGSSLHRGYDAAVVSAEAVRSCYAEAFNLPLDRVHATGVPKTDFLFDSARVAAVGRAVRERLGISPEQRVILVATTFRGRGQFTARHDSTLIDLPRLVAETGASTTVLVRNHPFARPEQPVDPPTGVVDVSGFPDADELLCAADLLVTDYSSILFDYALLRRPAVLYVPDRNAYEEERGIYFPLESYCWAGLAETMDGLIEAVRDPAMDEDALDRVLTTHMAACDGAATARVTNALILGKLGSKDSVETS